MYIARDKLGSLFLYTHKPIRQVTLFSPSRMLEGHIRINRDPDAEDLCPEVTWENSPRKVKSIKIELEDETNLDDKE